MAASRILSEPFVFDCTAAQAFDYLRAACMCIVAQRGRQADISGAFERNLQTVAGWLTCRNRRTFGLYLCGTTGNGKTTMMKAIQLAHSYLCQAKTSHQGSRSLTEGCELVYANDINLYAKAYHNPTALNKDQCARYKRIRDVDVLLIDDLAVEPSETMNFGEILRPVIEILTYRYDTMKCTIVTTNIPAQQIKDHYDGRIHDRFREMMYIINFGDEPSYRNR